MAEATCSGQAALTISNLQGRRRLGCYSWSLVACVLFIFAIASSASVATKGEDWVLEY